MLGSSMMDNVSGVRSERAGQVRGKMINIHLEVAGAGRRWKERLVGAVGRGRRPIGVRRVLEGLLAGQR